MFINQAEISLTLLGYGNKTDLLNGVSVEDIMKKTLLLQALLSEEFVIKKVLCDNDDFTKELEFMSSRGYLMFKDGVVTLD